MFHIVIGILFMLLAGCATQPTEQQHVWIHPASKSNQEFNQDRYRCLQESQQASGTYVGGMRNNPMMSSMGVMGTQTNNELLNACMQALGYSLVPAKGGVRPGIREEQRVS